VNTKSLSGIDPARFVVAQKALQALSLTALRRTNPQDPYAPGSLRWNAVLFPTNAYAQDTGMSLADFEDFVYRACFLDDEDPVARWQELSGQQERRRQRIRPALGHGLRPAQRQQNSRGWRTVF
jgi:aminopeptidase